MGYNRSSEGRINCPVSSQSLISGHGVNGQFSSDWPPSDQRIVALMNRGTIATNRCVYADWRLLSCGGGMPGVGWQMWRVIAGWMRAKVDTEWVISVFELYHCGKCYLLLLPLYTGVFMSTFPPSTVTSTDTQRVFCCQQINKLTIGWQTAGSSELADWGKVRKVVNDVFVRSIDDMSIT